MALLANKDTTNQLNERLSEFTQFGMILNYMMDIDKVNIKDLEKIFFDHDQDKATLIYTSVLKKIDPNDVDQSYAIYSNTYPNTNELTEDEYYCYLNSICINNILTKISCIKDTIDKSYFNTYNYLLENNYNFRK